MPIEWDTGQKHYYISRRSLCDNCNHNKAGRMCVDANERHTCENWEPPQFMFKPCRICGKMYELHETRKLRYVDVCPECQEKKKD